MWTSWLIAATAVHAAGPPEILAEAWLAANSPTEVRALTGLDLLWAEGREVGADGQLWHRVLVTQGALSELRRREIDVIVTRRDHRRGPPAEGYHGPDEATLRAVLDQAPRGGYVQLGESVEGRPLHALWLGQDPSTGAPSLRVLGAHHGDEPSSYEVALDLAWVLAEADGTDPEITALLDRVTVWIAPWVNPDGVVHGSRTNALGVDLNRNYGYRWSSSEYGSGDAPFSEPETRAIRTLALLDPPYASLSLHSGEENIGYVWNWTTDRAPEDATVEDLAWTYADACTTLGFWVTNGADWYPTRGDTNDWSYGVLGTMDFTVELTRDKAPPASKIDAFLDDHRQAVLAFLLDPPELTGRVVDATTGAPVEAELRLVDLGSPPFLSHAVSGAFARHLVDDDPISVAVSSPGYAARTLTLTPGATNTVELEPTHVEGAPVPTRVQGVTEVELPGAPAGAITLWRPGTRAVTLVPTDGTVLVDATDLIPGPWSISFADGTTWLRALFVVDASPRVDMATLGDTALTLEGAGFAPGTRAWALQGDGRVPHPLPVLAEDVATVVLDTSTVTDENFDVVVVSNGGVTALTDVTFDPWVDTGPAPDTGDDPDPDTDLEIGAGGCACQGAPGLSPVAWLLLLPVLLRRRP